jgi:hypothetical protein
MHVPLNIADTNFIMMRRFAVLASLLLVASFARTQDRDTPQPAVQNPSPMADKTRAHQRIQQQKYPGIEFKIFDILVKPVEGFIPQQRQRAKKFDLLLHFHGASFVVQYAATQYKGALVAATINLGAGSSVYGHAFEDSTKFPILLAAISDSLKQKLALPVTIQKIVLSGFSAGYGAIRKIISTPGNFNRVDAILLLDGIHASYVPEHRVLAEGGQIDSSGVAVFIRFAREATQKNSIFRRARLRRQYRAGSCGSFPRLVLFSQTVGKAVR